MSLRLRFSFANVVPTLTVAVAVAGCGGGDSSPVSTPSSTPYSMTLSPTTVSGTVTQGGYALPLTVTATLDRAPTQTYNIGVADSSGVLTTYSTVAAAGSRSFILSPTADGTVAPGTKTGSAQVQLCGDSVGTCAAPVSGSPWPLAYNITVFPSIASVAGQCSSLTAKKQWVRSVVDDKYLWYRDVPAVDSATAAATTTPEAYFDALRVTTPTASGKPRDQFSFSYDTAAWNALIDSGRQASYGAQITVVPNTRIVRITYVDAGSPAAAATVARGDTITAVNGTDIDTIGRDALIAALSPTQAGQTNTFTLRRVGGTSYTVSLTSALVTSNPVLLTSVIDSGNAKIGYIVFNDHLKTAQAQLAAAVQNLQAAGIDDLILDMRYNGGGYLYIAAQLGYMIGGTPTEGKVFERAQYSDKRASDTADPDNTFPFLPYRVDDNFNLTSTRLPTLGLTRVFVLTQGDTCSASESVINGLRGVDVNVILVGGTTCGKPYAFENYDNCGTSYFPIEFQGVNAKGFGDYADGFAPNCSATDDLSRALGDVNEGMLAVALTRRNTGACPVSAQTQSARIAEIPFAAESRLLRPPVRENRFVRP